MADPKDAIDRARDALARGAWAEVYDAYHALDPAALTGHDLEGLADAAWWLSKVPESLETRQRAYAAYAAEGDDLAAGAVAARLCIEHFARDEPSIGSGFLMRAHRHLDRHRQDHPEGPEEGFLAMVEANIARFSGDLERALALSRQAIEIGQRFADADLVTMAIHTEGLALIDAGRISEGVALLDEAMTAVIAGEVTPYFTGIIYCSLIQACLELSDLRRAAEWNDAAIAWCDALQPGSPFPGMCRVNRAEVARLRGAWPEAETEALRASEELAVIEPGLAAAAFIQVGEIRWRTGDFDGAETAFARAHELGIEPQPGLALLRLTRGKAEAAAGALRLAVASEQQRPRRARLLAAQVEVALATDDLPTALAAAAALEVMAREHETPAFDAAASTALGAVQLAEGDIPGAMERLRHAVAGWQDLRLPYDTAKARVLFARAIQAAGDEEGADLEFRAAQVAFEKLGAAPDAAAVARLRGAPGALPNGLTARECEVLRLVAAGKTNRDIAVELVISEHTVARHLQNMFVKLDVSSRSGATAFAFEHGLA